MQDLDSNCEGFNPVMLNSIVTLDIILQRGLMSEYQVKCVHISSLNLVFFIK
jgi:hypothetical protein